MEEELIKLTKRLITFKTITGNYGEIQKLFDYIKKYLCDLHIKQYENNNYQSLAISNTSITRKKFDIILHGHIDVAPVKNKKEFIPFIKGNRLYGRGSLDMKAGVACLIFLMKQLRLEPLNSIKILLLLTSDEEKGGSNGTEYLLKKIGFRSNFFLTAEGEKNYLIKVKQKGVLMIKLKSYGKGEHSAYTWVGKNAITQLFEAYEKIKLLFPENLSDKKHWYTTINLGKITGGLAANSIPDYAEADIDIRFCEPWQTPEQIFHVLKKAIGQYKGITIETIYKTNMMTTSIQNPYIRMLNAIAKKELGLSNDLYFQNHGTNDARFASECGIPAVAFGPIGANYHTNNEYVFIDSLVHFYKILKKYVSSYLNGSNSNK